MVLGAQGRPEEEGAQALCCLAWPWPRESSVACSSLFSLLPVIQKDAKQASFYFTVLKMQVPTCPTAPALVPLRSTLSPFSVSASAE